MFGIARLEKAIDKAFTDVGEGARTVGALRQQVASLEAENTRLRNDSKWFMHRLNQVELERAQLINAAIGVKLQVPQFKPPVETDAADVMNAMGAPFAGVGEDSTDPQDQIPAQEDFSHLPGYSRG